MHHFRRSSIPLGAVSVPAPTLTASPGLVCAAVLRLAAAERLRACEELRALPPAAWR